MNDTTNRGPSDTPRVMALKRKHVDTNPYFELVCADGIAPPARAIALGRREQDIRIQEMRTD